MCERANDGSIDAMRIFMFIWSVSDRMPHNNLTLLQDLSEVQTTDFGKIYLNNKNGCTSQRFDGRSCLEDMEVSRVHRSNHDLE